MVSFQVTFLQMQDPLPAPILKTENFTSCPFFSEEPKYIKSRVTRAKKLSIAPCVYRETNKTSYPRPSLDLAHKAFQTYFSLFPPQTLLSRQAEPTTAPHAHALPSPSRPLPVPMVLPGIPFPPVPDSRVGAGRPRVELPQHPLSREDLLLLAVGDHLQKSHLRLETDHLQRGITRRH